METSRGTRRFSRRRRGALAAALLPLPALLAPAPVHAGTTVSICSAAGERIIVIPAREDPSRRPDEQQGCVHFVCPRERAQGEQADDDEE